MPIMHIQVKNLLSLLEIGEENGVELVLEEEELQQQLPEDNQESKEDQIEEEVKLQLDWDIIQLHFVFLYEVCFGFDMLTYYEHGPYVQTIYFVQSTQIVLC